MSAMLELPEAVSLRDSLKEMMAIADSAAISPKYKSGRGIPAAVLGGIAAASWGFHSSIWSRFMETQSITPPPSEGLIYGMNNHGWVYYLSAAQSAQLDLLVYITIASFVFAAIIEPRVFSEKPCQNMLGQPAFFLLFILGSPHCCGQPHFGTGVSAGRPGLCPDETPPNPPRLHHPSHLARRLPPNPPRPRRPRPANARRRSSPRRHRHPPIRKVKVSPAPNSHPKRRARSAS